MGRFFLLVHLLVGGALAQEQDRDRARCAQRTAQQSFRFGSAFDRYLRGSTPTPGVLQSGAWKLTGVATGPTSQLMEGNDYQPTGYTVDGRVPKLHFLSGEGLRKFPPLAGAEWQEGDFYAVRSDWGIPALRMSRFHIPTDWTDRSPLQRESITFPVVVYEGGYLFRPAHAPVATDSKVQLYCRNDFGHLICMGEERSADGTAGAVSIFLQWERDL